MTQTPRLVFAATIALATTLLASAAPHWRVVETPHSRILSQLPEQDTVELAQQFEQFTEAVSQFIVVEPGALQPITIVAFASEREFKPYWPHIGGSKQQKEAAGFFAQPGYGAIIGLRELFSGMANDDSMTRHAILHETTHWITNAARVQVPLWLREGLAETCATAEFNSDRLVLGQPFNPLVKALRAKTWMPYDQLAAVTPRDPEYNDNNRNSLFYGQAWLVTHHLIFEKGAAGIATINQLAGNHPDPKANFVRAIGRTPAQLQEDLQDYLKYGQFSFQSLPRSTALAALKAAPATEAQVAVALGRLAFAGANFELARTQAEKARQAAPATPEPYALLAVVERQAKNVPAVAAATERALALRSQDPEVYFLRAWSLDRLAEAAGTPEKNVAEVVTCLRRSIALAPRARDARLEHSRRAPKLEPLAAEDVALISESLRLFPEESYLLVGLARIARLSGSHAEADKLLNHVLAAPDRLLPWQLNQCQSLRVDWDVRSRCAEIDALTTAGRTAEALAACAELEKQQLPGYLAHLVTRSKETARAKAAP